LKTQLYTCIIESTESLGNLAMSPTGSPTMFSYKNILCQIKHPLVSYTERIR